MAPLRVQIGKARFDFDIIRPVLELPGLRIAPGGPTDTHYFTFAGGDGLMSPRRPVDADVVFEIGFRTEGVAKE